MNYSFHFCLLSTSYMHRFSIKREKKDKSDDVEHMFLNSKQTRCTITASLTKLLKFFKLYDQQK